MRTIAVAAALVALQAACGSAGKQPRCTADGQCAAGTICEVPVSGEDGVCITAYRVALEAPAAGGWVGASAAVRARVVVQASGRSLPGTVELLANGAPVATLARQGTTEVYQGTWAPAAGTSGQVTLVVRAGAARDQSDSAPVGVKVDLVAPVITGPSVDCPQGVCLRDGVMTVRATVGEENLKAVTATLNLPGPVTVTMAAGGGQQEAAVDLKTRPFPHLKVTTTVTVRAEDQAGNAATLDVPVTVTRVRWEYVSGATEVTSPAVLEDGGLVAGLNTAANQLFALNPDGTKRWELTVGSSATKSPPSIGPTAIWVAGGSKVYAVALDGSGILNGSGCDTGGAVAGTPAVASGDPETVFVGSLVGRMWAVDAAGACVRSLPTDGFVAPPAIDRTGLVLAATATATATLRQYLYAGAFGENWSRTVGVSVSAPIALDGSDGAWTGSQDAQLKATTPAGVVRDVKTLPGSVGDSPVIVAGGDVVVGDQTGTLHRYQPDGTQVWTTEPVLGGAVKGPVALAGSEPSLIVPTGSGTLHAVRASDGAALWSGQLATAALKAGNVSAPTSSPFSTAYFGSDDGKLYAVIVDGNLDVAAPWPKAHRDLKNTANAGRPLP